MAKQKQTEYDKIMDALNIIDEHAERGLNDDYDSNVIRAKAYTKVADFINKYAKRKVIKKRSTTKIIK